MTGQARLAKLRDIMRRAGLDIVALAPGPSHFYISGARHIRHERPIVALYPLDGQPAAVIPELEIPLFQRHAQPPRLFVYGDDEGSAGAFQAAFRAMGAADAVIGVEGLRMRFFEGELLRRAAPRATVIDASHALVELRLHKDRHEIAKLRRAVAISEAALKATLTRIKVGMSEIEAARILEGHIAALGGQGLAFETILHAGGNSALPHSPPLPYRIQPGDPLLIDFGARVEGYCADITRCFVVGAASQAQLEFHAVVQAANRAARDLAGPGIAAEALDMAARQVIIEAGYGSLLRHRAGHGIGLEAYEAPYIAPGNRRLLEPGMVFTLEPGIYRIGEIGIRIEDMLLITDDGAECLTSLPRELVVI